MQQSGLLQGLTKNYSARPGFIFVPAKPIMVNIYKNSSISPVGMHKSIHVLKLKVLETRMVESLRQFFLEFYY